VHYSLKIKSGGNNFNYFPESLISIFNKNNEIGGDLDPWASLVYAIAWQWDLVAGGMVVRGF